MTGAVVLATGTLSPVEQSIIDLEVVRCRRSFHPPRGYVLAERQEIALPNLVLSSFELESAANDAGGGG